jgi:hypothetical protein
MSRSEDQPWAPERINAWAMRITNILSKESTEDAVRALIAEVRREVLEEAAKVCDDLFNTNADGTPRSGVRQLRVHTVYASALRQLAEREGER